MYLGKSWWPSDPMFNGALSDFQLAVGYAFTSFDARNMAAGLGAPPPRNIVSAIFVG